MDRTQVIDQLKRVLVDDLFVAVPIDQIRETDEIGSDLGLDSIGFTELATIVGEMFKIEVSDEDITQSHFATLGTIADFVLARRETGIRPSGVGAEPVPERS